MARVIRNPEAQANPQAAPPRRGFGYGQPAPSPSQEMYGFEEGPLKEIDAQQIVDILRSVSDALPEPIRKLVMSAAGVSPGLMDVDMERTAETISEALRNPEDTVAGKILSKIYGPYVSAAKNSYDAIFDRRDKYYGGGAIKKYGAGGMKKNSYEEGGEFPDLTGDGKVTMADILKGRGVGK